MIKRDKWYCECCEKDVETDCYEVGGEHEYVCLSCYENMMDGADYQNDLLNER